MLHTRRSPPPHVVHMTLHIGNYSYPTRNRNIKSCYMLFRSTTVLCGLDAALITSQLQYLRSQPQLSFPRYDHLNHSGRQTCTSQTLLNVNALGLPAFAQMKQDAPPSPCPPACRCCATQQRNVPAAVRGDRGAYLRVAARTASDLAISSTTTAGSASITVASPPHVLLASKSPVASANTSLIASALRQSPRVIASAAAYMHGCSLNLSSRI